MDRTYRAVPLDNLYAPHLEVHWFRAASDLAAMTEAKQHFGSEMPFVLWDGERKALTYKPLVHLMQSKGSSAAIHRVTMAVRGGTPGRILRCQ